MSGYPDSVTVSCDLAWILITKSQSACPRRAKNDGGESGHACIVVCREPWIIARASHLPRRSRWRAEAILRRRLSRRRFYVARITHRDGDHCRLTGANRSRIYDYKERGRRDQCRLHDQRPARSSAYLRDGEQHLHMG